MSAFDGPTGRCAGCRISAQVHLRRRAPPPASHGRRRVDITEREQAKEAVSISQERQAFLLTVQRRDPADRRSGDDPDGWPRPSSAGQLRASRVHYGEVSEDGAWGVVREDYCDGVSSVVGKYRLDSYGPSVMAEFRAGRTLVIDDVGTDERLTPHERRRDPGAGDRRLPSWRRFVKGGRPVAASRRSVPRRRIGGRIPSFPCRGGRERTWARGRAGAGGGAPRRCARTPDRDPREPRRSPPSSRTATCATSGSKIPRSVPAPRSVVGKTDVDLFEREEDAHALIAIKQRVLDTGVAGARGSALPQRGLAGAGTT